MKTSHSPLNSFIIDIHIFLNEICFVLSISQGHCYVKDLAANVKRFPAFIPNGDYYMILIFYTKLNDTDNTLLNLKLFAEVKTLRSG